MSSPAALCSSTSWTSWKASVSQALRRYSHPNEPRKRSVVFGQVVREQRHLRCQDARLHWPPLCESGTASSSESGPPMQGSASPTSTETRSCFRGTQQFQATCDCCATRRTPSRRRFVKRGPDLCLLPTPDIAPLHVMDLLLQPGRLASTK